jgi:hypothetical protein
LTIWLAADDALAQLNDFRSGVRFRVGAAATAVLVGPGYAALRYNPQTQTIL